MSSIDDQQGKLSSTDLNLWLWLNHIPGLGNAAFCQLLAKFGSPEGIFSAKLNQLREIVNDEIAQKISKGVNVDAIAPTLKWLEKDNVHLITLADSTYPQKLLEVSNPPALLFAIGHLHWLNHPTIAMVGSRSPTPQGEKNAEDFAPATGGRRGA